MIEGTVQQGINNIYIVRSGNDFFECRIKGKLLSEETRAYNPLAPGDRVMFEIDPHQKNTAMITERLERKNRFVRFNKKRSAPQILAANVDLILCISSVKSPPFRPRFIDRVLVSAHSEIPVAIVVNKTDLGISSDADYRIKVFEKIGYRVFRTSAARNTGIRPLVSFISGKRVMLIGQSGAGKSSICNAISPLLTQKIGKISGKYNRGSHTTCYSAMFSWKKDSEIIDTPGIREIEIYGIEAEDLGFYFNEFLQYYDKCQFSKCTHTHEPSCAVKEAVEHGYIDSDRYESYLRIYYEMENSK